MKSRREANAGAIKIDGHSYSIVKESGIGLPHSKTLADETACSDTRQRLGVRQPYAAITETTKTARRFQSHPAKAIDSGERYDLRAVIREPPYE